jgi:hypothetical protein
MAFAIQWTGPMGPAMTQRDSPVETLKYAIEMRWKYRLPHRDRPFDFFSERLTSPALPLQIFLAADPHTPRCLSPTQCVAVQKNFRPKNF